MLHPRLRPMTVEDIPAVVAIERRAMESGWEPGAYRNELTQNTAARYFVCELMTEDAAPVIAGFAGLWLQFDQAHVVTVAVDPYYQRNGLGRLLVHVLLTTARTEGMVDATLEVRASNGAARALYREYGFFEVGLRKRYYLDNGEDAVIMTTEAFDSPNFQRRFAEATSKLDVHFPGAAIRDAETTGSAPDQED